MTDEELWGWCRHWARRHSEEPTLDRDDIASEMFIECKRAWPRYDASKGASERTYCYQWARHAAARARERAHPQGRGAYNHGLSKHPVENAPEPSVSAREMYGAVEVEMLLEQYVPKRHLAEARRVILDGGMWKDSDGGEVYKGCTPAYKSARYHLRKALGEVYGAR